MLLLLLEVGNLRLTDRIVGRLVCLLGWTSASVTRLHGMGKMLPILNIQVIGVPVYIQIRTGVHTIRAISASIIRRRDW